MTRYFLMRSMVAAGLLFAASAVSCESFTEVIGPTRYASTIDGAQVKPSAVTVTATGTLTAALHATTREFSYTIGWEDLSGVATAVHLHGPADQNQTASSVVDFSALPTGSTGTISLEATGSATGTMDLTRPVSITVSGDSLRKLLNAGLLYVDIHTVANPNGEIRGRVRPQ